MDDLTKYLETNRERFEQELMDVLRIPSVSTDPAYKDDVRKCAEHIAAHLREIGMTKAEVRDTKGHPLVYAEWLGAPGKPTILIYGHHDVQPPDPLDLWKTPPFEPVLKDGKMYARGAVDDKGQTYMHVKAVEAHLKTHGKLPVNVKMIIEGEEETGSHSLEPYVLEHKKELACDIIVVSDTAMVNENTPALTFSLRGMSYTEIHVTGPAHDLHSGHFGGAVENPGWVLCSIIAKLKDADGRILIPGFYDGVPDTTDEDRKAMAVRAFDEKAFLKETGSPRLHGEKGYSTLEHVTMRPTLDVNGMWGGYQGAGSKTVLPSHFAAKVSMRLVPGQHPDDIFEKLSKYVKSLTPDTVTSELRDVHHAVPFITDPDSKPLEAARKALARVWPNPPVMVREGGSIPVMESMQRIFGVPFIFMGFGLDDDQVHAPNEKFNMSSYHGGIRSAAYLYEELGALKP